LARGRLTFLACFRAEVDRFRLVAEFSDGTSAEIPLHGGKPVKSRLKVERKKKHDDAGAPLSA